MSADDIISWKYNDSHDVIKKGDLVFYDNLPGRIEEVCMPDTQLAEYFSCEDTGGLLIQFDDGPLVLEPFGQKNRVIRRNNNERQS